MICFSAKPAFVSEYHAHLMRIWRLLIKQGYGYTCTQVDEALIRSCVPLLTLHDMLDARADTEITRRFFAEIEN